MFCHFIELDQNHAAEVALIADHAVGLFHEAVDHVAAVVVGAAAEAAVIGIATEEVS